MIRNVVALVIAALAVLCFWQIFVAIDRFNIALTLYQKNSAGADMVLFVGASIVLSLTAWAVFAWPPTR